MEPLKNLSLELHQGKFIGLRGISGSGKSTLAMILSRLDDDYDGELLLTPPAKPKLSNNARSLISGFLNPIFPGLLYLGPQPMVYSDTVLNNVSFGTDTSKNYSKTRVSLENAGLTELANDLEMLVGCGGRALSAGECQRLACARVFYFCPNFIILDEATSSMDEETERRIMERLRGHLPLLGALIISHRDKTYQYVDQTYFLNDGTLVPSSS